MVNDDRGQAFTLEGIVSGVIVLTALLIALQTISIAPATTGSTDDAAALRTQANDVMTLAAEQGHLRDVVLCGQNGDGDVDVISSDASPYRAIGNSKANTDSLKQSATDFGDMLRVAFTDRGFNYRVEFAYLDNGGDRKTVYVFPLSASGSNPRPASRDPAVVATRTVTLFDDMETTGIKGDGDGHPTSDPPAKFCDADESTAGGALLKNARPSDTVSGNKFYLPDVSNPENDDLYNVVEVRLIVW